MLTFVLDTSVLVKWFHQSDESHVKQALQILQDAQDKKVIVIISSFAIIELLNALIKGSQFSQEEIDITIKRLFKLPIIFYDKNLHLFENTAWLMSQYKLTSYDAHFLALAKEEKCKLISDDRKGHGKITNGTIVMLEDYDLPAILQ